MPLRNDAPKHNRHRRPSACRRHGRRAVALTVTGTLSAAGMVLAAGAPASADSHPVSQAEGKFLSGTVLGENLDTLLELDWAQAENTGSPTQVEEVNPLGVTALNSIDVPLGPINLLGDNGILSLGAVNQYARARNDGSSRGASGAVTDSGAIAVDGTAGTPANASLDLSDLLDDAGVDLLNVLTDLQLEIGALSARADQAAGAEGNQTSSYQIADLELTLGSPVVAGLLGPLLGQQGEITAIPGLLKTLVDPLDLLGILSTSELPVLADLVDDLGTLTSGDGSLTVNLSTGVITVDLEQIINLNNLAPNTPLLPYVLTALTTQLVPTVAAGLDDLTDDLTAALEGVTAELDLLGVITPVTDIALGTVIDPVIATLTGTLDDVLDDNLDLEVFDNLLGDALGDLLTLTANVQDDPPNLDAEFTVTALRVGVLPTASAVVLNLASASVGPNAGPHDEVPVALSIDPDEGPTAGGTVVTITGSGFTDDATVSVDGSAPIVPQSISGDGTTVVYIAPPHAAGPVGVTVTTAGGTTAPLTYTYIPPAVVDDELDAPVITNPEDDSTTEDTTPPIRGTGTPGLVVTVREGTTTLCTATVRANGTWNCTPANPLSLGDHTIRATQSDGDRTSAASAPVTFTIVAADEPPAPPVDPGLPATGGSNMVPVAATGLGLLLSGMGMMLAPRSGSGRHAAGRTALPRGRHARA